MEEKAETAALTMKIPCMKRIGEMEMKESRRRAVETAKKAQAVSAAGTPVEQVEQVAGGATMVMVETEDTETETTGLLEKVTE